MAQIGDETMNEVAKCTICGEPMPAGEEMFKFHGYSGPCPNPPMPKEEPKGLFCKYRVERTDGKPIEPGQEFFVLRLDFGGDINHAMACRKAVMIYADEIESHLPDLAADLRARYAP